MKLPAIEQIYVDVIPIPDRHQRGQCGSCQRTSRIDG